MKGREKLRQGLGITAMGSRMGAEPGARTHIGLGNWTLHSSACWSQPMQGNQGQSRFRKHYSHNPPLRGCFCVSKIARDKNAIMKHRTFLTFSVMLSIRDRNGADAIHTPVWVLSRPGRAEGRP